jgi:exportin-1
MFEHFLQVGENEPFVSELLSNLVTTIADLEPHQIHTFYESVRRIKMNTVLHNIFFYPLLIFPNTFSALTIQVGHMIQAESDNAKRDEYLKRLMSLPNQVSCFAF